MIFLKRIIITIAVLTICFVIGYSLSSTVRYIFFPEPAKEKVIKVDQLIDYDQVKAFRELRTETLGKLYKKEDKSRDITWYYYPISHPTIQIDLGVKGNYAWLSLYICQYSDRKVSPNSIYLCSSEKVKKVDLNKPINTEYTTNNKIKEWSNTLILDSCIPYLRKFANSKDPMILISGRQDDLYTLTVGEQKGLVLLLEAYDAFENHITFNDNGYINIDTDNEFCDKYKIKEFDKLIDKL